MPELPDISTDFAPLVTFAFGFWGIALILVIAGAVVTVLIRIFTR